MISVLLEQQISTLFGYPGGQVLDLYDALSRHPEIHHVLTAHEQGAAHAADGYARATGKTGVVIATSGPGATNLVTGIAAAHLDSTPMVIITGNVALSLLGRDSFQEIDIAGITIPITKHNYIVKEIADLAPTLRQAFQIAASGRPGPVLVDIPKNIQQAKAEYFPQPPLPLLPLPQPSEQQLNQAAEMLQKAKRPFVYCGGGVSISNAGQALLTLSQLIDAPIGCTMMGLSALPAGTHMGLMGMHGNQDGGLALAEADVVLAVGMRFSERATGNKAAFAPKAKILHIDIDPAEINKNIPADLALIGDCGTVLQELASRLSPVKHPTWRQKTKLHPRPAPSAMSPQWIIEQTAAVTKDFLVATDVGQHQMWTAQYYPLSHPRSLLTSGGLGAMGFGMGAALGAMIATEKRGVLFTGDGSFGMNVTELATAVSNHLPLLVIVLNNQALGMVRQWQELFYRQRYSATLLHRSTDFSAVAKGYGANGFCARTPKEFQAALEQGIKSSLPTVIDCQISRQENVFPMIPPGGSVQDMITDL